ncbi:tetratricopeptide repeat protein [Nodularia sp. NIES-3585]|uniref:tetratricopeptide repeat protein n=1 Tax=Nodularia sp. NIES-3585 TaxID=1973477 RepID=UPI000B6F0053|nr:tetratricopeptide repeat protein [Nodularia sp. NIES-3585]GAX38842.1 TPR repeat-containing protein [Nodularia sp. NIES-3585]
MEAMEAIDLEQAQLWYEKGIEYITKGNLDEVERCFTAALYYNPNFAEVHNAIGLILLRIEKYPGAIQLFDSALAMNLNFAEAYSNRALARSKICHKTEFNLLLDDLNKAISLKPDLAEAYFNRAWVHKAFLIDNQAAIQDYNQAISINPEYIEAYLHRGDTYFLSGELEESIQDFDKALALDTDYVEAYRSRGVARFQLGDVDGAKDDLFKAFDLFYAQNNIVHCVFTRSVIMRLFPDYEIYKHLFGVENKMAT